MSWQGYGDEPLGEPLPSGLACGVPRTGWAVPVERTEALCLGAGRLGSLHQPGPSGPFGCDDIGLA